MASFTASSAIEDISFGLDLLSSFGTQVDIVGVYSMGGQVGPVAPSVSGLSGLISSNSIVNSIVGQNSNVAAPGQMFVKARPLKATVRETSRIMEHPVETGVMLADHHIINPVEIEMPMVIPSQYYVQTYAEIKNSFINATLLVVKTPVNTYQNMIVMDMPHEEDPNMFGVILMGLRLKQVLYATTGQSSADFAQANYAPLAPQNSNTTQNGLQTATALGTSALTSASSALSYINAFKGL